jgi:hypothetical protein
VAQKRGVVATLSQEPALGVVKIDLRRAASGNQDENHQCNSHLFFTRAFFTCFGVGHMPFVSTPTCRKTLHWSAENLTSALESRNTANRISAMRPADNAR